MSEAYSASNRQMHYWGAGAMADYMLFVSFQALIMPIFSIGFGISPALVGFATMLPRLIDAAIDPWMGHFSDELRTPWGRRRPFLLVSAVIGALALTALYWPSPEWSQWVKFAWLQVFSVILYICYGAFTMNHQALGYELSDDFNIRARVQAIRGAWFSVTAFMGGWLYWTVQQPIFGGEVGGIRWISMGMAVIIVGAALVTVLFSRERFQNRPRKPHIPLLPAIKQTLKVKPFVILLLLRVLGTLGVGLYAHVGFFITTFYICQGDKEQSGFISGILGSVGLALSILLVPLATWISRMIDRRQGFILGFALTFFGAVTLPFFAQPGKPWVFIWYLIAMTVFGHAVSLFQFTVMPDICDIDELQSGERREGLFSAVITFVTKIENSLCLLISGALVSWAGYDAALGAKQPDEVVTNLLWFGFAPKIVFAALAMVLAFYFPITRKMMADVRAQLEERRKAAAAAAATTTTPTTPT